METPDEPLLSINLSFTRRRAHLSLSVVGNMGLLTFDGLMSMSWMEMAQSLPAPRSAAQVKRSGEENRRASVFGAKRVLPRSSGPIDETVSFSQQRMAL